MTEQTPECGHEAEIEKLRNQIRQLNSALKQERGECRKAKALADAENERLHEDLSDTIEERDELRRRLAQLGFGDPTGNSSSDASPTPLGSFVRSRLSKEVEA